MEDRFQKAHSKAYFEDIAIRVPLWLERVLTYYDQTQWVFLVDKKGKFLPAERLQEMDAPRSLEVSSPLSREGLKSSVQLTLPKKEPYSWTQMKVDIERVHKMASVVLISTVGIGRANKILQDLREKWDLKKVPSKMAWSTRKGKQ